MSETDTRPGPRCLEVSKELKRLAIVLEVTTETIARMDQGDSAAWERLNYKHEKTANNYHREISRSLRWERKAKLRGSLLVIVTMCWIAVSVALVAALMRIG